MRRGDAGAGAGLWLHDPARSHGTTMPVAVRHLLDSARRPLSHSWERASHLRPWLVVARQCRGLHEVGLCGSSARRRQRSEERIEIVLWVCRSLSSHMRPCQARPKSDSDPTSPTFRIGRPVRMVLYAVSVRREDQRRSRWHRMLSRMAVFAEYLVPPASRGSPASCTHPGTRIVSRVAAADYRGCRSVGFASARRRSQGHRPAPHARNTAILSPFREISSAASICRGLNTNGGRPRQCRLR